MVAPQAYIRVLTGPVVHFHVFGRRFILLNTLEAATDLFEKRSGTYSTKPRLVSTPPPLTPRLYRHPLFHI